MTDSECYSLIIQGTATIVIPFVLLLVGHWLTTALKQKDLAQGYVQLAVDVLKTKMPPGSEELREWAVEVLNKYSEIPLPTQARADLVEHGLRNDSERLVRLYVVDENSVPVGNAVAYIYHDGPRGRVAVSSTHVHDSPALLQVPEYSEGDYFARVRHPDYEDFNSEPGPLESLDGLCVTLSPKNRPAG